MAIRVVSTGATIVKKVTVGTPTQIGVPSTGALLRLDDVNGSVNLADGSYLRYDSATGLFEHRLFDSDVLQAIRSGGGVSAGITWTPSGARDEIRTATGFVDSDKQSYRIRTTAFNNNGLLELGLAYFSPSINVPDQTLNWDEPATSFELRVTNPDDFLSQWLDSVDSLLQVSADGILGTNISKYSLSDKLLMDSLGATVTDSSGPVLAIVDSSGGGVDWKLIFTATNDSDAGIRSTADSDTLLGGSVTGKIFVADNLTDSAYDSDEFTISWGDASLELTMSNLTGNTFLKTYPSTAYTVTKNNVLTPANHIASISGVGGSVSDSTGSGTFTFTSPLHKDNAGGRTLNGTVTFNRPAGITNYGAYSVVDSGQATTLSADFTFPSFWIFTVGTGTPPTSADIVVGTDYAPAVTSLGDEASTFAGMVNNPGSSAQAFWFGVRTAAGQPSSFLTGSGPGLLVAASVTNSTVNLEPTSPPVGYNAEAYSLYGITLQPGNTYVSIS